MVYFTQVMEKHHQTSSYNFSALRWGREGRTERFSIFKSSACAEGSAGQSSRPRGLEKRPILGKSTRLPSRTERRETAELAELAGQTFSLSPSAQTPGVRYGLQTAQPSPAAKRRTPEAAVVLQLSSLIPF